MVIVAVANNECMKVRNNMVQRRNYSNQEVEKNQEFGNNTQLKKETFGRKKVTTKTKECKVLSHSKNKTTVDFEGYGVIVDGIFNDTVKVEYTGQIGTSSFKIINII